MPPRGHERRREHQFPVGVQRLGTAEVHAVGLAAAENALAIMEDAKALLDAGRYQRAYALGVIATEEAAKFNLCRDVKE